MFATGSQNITRETGGSRVKTQESRKFTRDQNGSHGTKSEPIGSEKGQQRQLECHSVCNRDHDEGAQMAAKGTSRQMSHTGLQPWKAQGLA